MSVGAQTSQSQRCSPTRYHTDSSCDQRRGRLQAGFYELPGAHVAAAEIVKEHLHGAAERERVERERRERGASFREIAQYREVIVAAYNYARKPSTYNLAENPAQTSDKRRKPSPAALVFYCPEEIEALARALENGCHRDPSRPAVSGAEKRARSAEDRQDAEIIRVAAYAGLRMGELLALRFGDVDFAGCALSVGRAISAGVLSSTKSGKVRRVPLAEQAAAALERMSRREQYTSREDLVFCNALGRTLDDSALRKRYKRAQNAAMIPSLRFHDLRHTFGSLLAARGIDVVSIQDSMGHADITTTRRYLHARPISEQAEAFTRAFEPAPPPDAAASA